MGSALEPIELWIATRRPRHPIYQLARFLSLAFLCVVLSPVGTPSVAAQQAIIPEGNPDVTLEGVLIDARGVAIDRDGNIYVADTGNHVVRKYSSAGTPLTVFGRETHPGSGDGGPIDVRFSFPTSIAVDRAGNILVVDGGVTVFGDISGTGKRIRRIDPNTRNYPHGYPASGGNKRQMHRLHYMQVYRSCCSLLPHQGSGAR